MLRIRPRLLRPWRRIRTKTRHLRRHLSRTRKRTTKMMMRRRRRYGHRLPRHLRPRLTSRTRSEPSHPASQYLHPVGPSRTLHPPPTATATATGRELQAHRRTIPSSPAQARPLRQRRSERRLTFKPIAAGDRRRPAQSQLRGRVWLQRTSSGLPRARDSIRRFGRPLPAPQRRTLLRDTRFRWFRWR